MLLGAGECQRASGWVPLWALTQSPDLRIAMCPKSTVPHVVPGCATATRSPHTAEKERADVDDRSGQPASFGCRNIRMCRRARVPARRRLSRPVGWGCIGYREQHCRAHPTRPLAGPNPLLRPRRMRCVGWGSGRHPFGAAECQAPKDRAHYKGRHVNDAYDQCTARATNVAEATAAFADRAISDRFHRRVRAPLGTRLATPTATPAATSAASSNAPRNRLMNPSTLASTDATPVGQSFSLSCGTPSAAAERQR
jgi:hypothetical protein